MKHHWIEIAGKIYEFSKGTLVYNTRFEDRALENVESAGEKRYTKKRLLFEDADYEDSDL